MFLERDQALRMKYVDFPQIQKPTVNAKPEKGKVTTEPVRWVIQWSTDSNITINGKTYKLPTAKGYILKEYADVCKWLGEYHIQLKNNYRPVWHPMGQVAVSFKPA